MRRGCSAPSKVSHGTSQSENRWKRRCGRARSGSEAFLMSLLSGSSTTTRQETSSTSTPPPSGYSASSTGTNSRGGYVVLIQDITVQVKEDIMRRQAYEQIQQNIEQFAILGDHVRQPLQVILGMVELSGAGRRWISFATRSTGSMTSYGSRTSGGWRRERSATSSSGTSRRERRDRRRRPCPRPRSRRTHQHPGGPGRSGTARLQI
ncbi:MAG: hypothetical protein PWR21_1564 [Methanoculleus sp.]|nr:hypothetical protein [Methanoculleus sp.]